MKMSELSSLSKELLSFCVKLAVELVFEGLGDLQGLESDLQLLPVVLAEVVGT